MYHFVVGYEGCLGLGPVFWKVCVRSHGDRATWPRMLVRAEGYEKQVPIGIHDDTDWHKMPQEHRDFWSAKGFNDLNWIGKPAYPSDVATFTYKGKSEMVVIIKINSYACLMDKDGCLKDIPLERKAYRLFIHGNVSQNPDLLDEFKTRQYERLCLA